MSAERRYVFDTNVTLSALLFDHSTPAEAFYTAAGSGCPLLSLPTLVELNEVLARPKFDRYVTRDERERFLKALVATAALVDTDEVLHVCRDPRDDQFLELAVCGRATCIVSGDADLLSLEQFRGIPILTPAQFS